MFERWKLWTFGYPDEKNNFVIVFGKIILSLWIVVLLITAFGVILMIIADPASFFGDDSGVSCTTVEDYSGEGVDTCDFILP